MKDGWKRLTTQNKCISFSTSHVSTSGSKEVYDLLIHKRQLYRRCAVSRECFGSEVSQDEWRSMQGWLSCNILAALIQHYLTGAALAKASATLAWRCLISYCYDYIRQIKQKHWNCMTTLKQVIKFCTVIISTYNYLYPYTEEYYLHTYVHS